MAKDPNRERRERKRNAWECHHHLPKEREMPPKTLGVAKAVRLGLTLATPIALMMGLGTVAEAQSTTFWSNSAGGSGPILSQWDINTGALIQTIVAPHGFNGRGIVDVGNVLYYTDASDNHVYAYNFVTHTDLGTAFTVAGAIALSTMAYDGTNFWIGDYSGTDKAYLYTPTGTLLKTITLANCGGSCDGLEYFNGELISNRADEPNPGIYDVYDLNGNLLHSALITDPTNSTGIGFDGTDFYVDNGGDPNNGANAHVNVYDINGNFVRRINLTGESYNYIGEDLSFDYNVVLNTTPEPSTLVLLTTGLLGVAGVARKRIGRAKSE